SMMSQVILKAPSNDRLPFLLGNPSIKQEVLPYFMARIVDVKTFLELYPFSQADCNSSFRLQVSDTFAPWNNQTFSVEIDRDGHAAVETLTGKQSDAIPIQVLDADLSCDIQTLTVMLMGYQRPSFLHSIGRLSTESDLIEQWEHRIPHSTTYLADFF
ncbi:MAG: family acetyltransferase, partial [Bacilli bacterium]|nr:family acetyltransferase [Bacilli bacterium]